MKLILRFGAGTKALKFDTYDEIRSAIVSEVENIKDVVFSYCWFEDGFCDCVAEDPNEETDIAKMLDMAIVFTQQFGHCIFDYEDPALGKTKRIFIYTEEYDKGEKKRRKEMNIVKGFVNEGKDCYFFSDAIYTALDYALNGKVKTIKEAISIAKKILY